MTGHNFRNLIDEVRSRTDIVQVVSQRVELNKHNKGLCPFHDEKTPSFSVNPAGQYFKCFGCGVGGDVIKFIQLYKNITFKEALTELARRAGVRISINGSQLL